MLDLFDSAINVGTLYLDMTSAEPEEDARLRHALEAIGLEYHSNDMQIQLTIEEGAAFACAVRAAGAAFAGGSGVVVAH